jgi:hypothetical protein
VRDEEPMTMRLVFLLVFLCLFSGCALESAIKGIPWLGDIYRLPDIDQRFVDIPVVNLFICHRSILTHNAVLPLVVAWICRPFKKWGAIFPLVVGSLFALHFLLDLFPKKWYGYAFIHIPILGWLDWIPYDSNWVPTVFSIFWLALNALLSQGAFLYTLKPEMRINPFSR